MTIAVKHSLRRSFSALFALAALSACSILPESDPVQLLDPKLAVPEPASRTADWTLNVARPEADPLRDSTRVLVRTGQGQLQVHSSARWVASAPEVLRTLLVRHLRDSLRVAQVTAGAAGQDRTLAMDVRRFELAEIGGDRLRAEIQVEARLYDSRSGELLVRQLFEGQAPTVSSQPGRILDGFEAVLGNIIPALAEWVTKNGRVAPD